MGGRFIRDLGYNIGYTIINDNATGQPFVYIFMADLKPQEFGLKVPSNVKESKQHITNAMNQTIYLKESELKQMIENR